MSSIRSITHLAVGACSALALALSAAAQPANNVCGANQAMFTIPGTGGTVNGTTVAATVDGNACAGAGGDIYWYFTPNATGPWAISLCSTTNAFDTVLSVHSNSCPATTANFVTAASCNDDTCGLLSDLPSVTLTAGVQYIIRVASYGATTGAVRLTVSAPLPPAQNNVCANIASQPAFNFTGTGFTATGSLTGATTDGWSNIGGGVNGCDNNNTAAAPASRNDVWYRFTPSVSNNYNFSMCGSMVTWDSVLSVHTACPDAGAGVSNTIACNDDGVCMAGVGLSAITGVPLNAGVPVIIRVCHWGAGAASADQFQLQVTSDPLGGCCRTDGSCGLLTPSACTTAGGTYGGDGSACAALVCTGACCNPTSGICTSTGPAACVSPDVFQSVGTTCTPNPCPQPPPPANDECAGAFPVNVGIPAVNGFNNTATTGGGDVHSCVAGINGVWYSFVSPSNSSWQIDTNGTAFDTVLSVFDSCGGTELACDDDGGNGTDSLVVVTLSTNQSVHILVSAFNTGTGGPFTLNISAIVMGACCNTLSGICTTTTNGAAGCAGGTTYQGDNSVCDPSPCPATGACCNPATGACTTTTTLGCASPNSYQGDGIVCSPNPCPQPPPPANDECTSAQALMLNVAFLGTNTTATGDGSEGPGGACYAQGTTNFVRSVWFAFTAPASDVYGVTTCGSDFDIVLSIFDGTCASIGGELGCDDDTCDGITPPGSGLASIITPVSMTAGQTYLIRLAAWTNNGAAVGGMYTITVTGTPVVTTGVCCRGATCNTTVSQANCTPDTNAGASFAASATTCNLNASLTTPCCYADYDKSGSVAVPDIFAYINDWFGSSPYAVIGGNGTGPGATVTNLFDWINAWFAGC